MEQFELCWASILENIRQAPPFSRYELLHELYLKAEEVEQSLVESLIIEPL